MSSPVRYDVVDRVAVITIDNPPVNALSATVWEAIDQAVGRAAADPSVDAAVLIGAGTTFIAGADIKVFDTLTTREQSLERSARSHDLLNRLEDCPKLLVAAIHGNALGGGNEVAMACHYRIATADARLGQPEVLLGIIPGAGGTQRLPRLVGVALALKMCTDGQAISAGEAQASGLVDRIVAGNLRDSAIAFASERLDRRKTRDQTEKIGDVAAGLAACAHIRATLGKTARGQKAPSRLWPPFKQGSSSHSTSPRHTSVNSSPTVSCRPNRRRSVICSSPSVKRPRFPTCPKRRQRARSRGRP